LAFQRLIGDFPMIPAVRSVEHLDEALDSSAHVVYLLCGDVTTVPRLILKTHAASKLAVVNLDLVSGLSGTAPAVDYLADCGADGIISTHAETLKAAHARGLLGIQRTFMLDSLALRNVLRSLTRYMPDAIEILPAAVAPGVMGALRERHPGITVIAGGLVASLREIDVLVSSGVAAVSVSERSLWRLAPRG